MKDADGIVVTPRSGPAKRVRLQALSDRIVRVTAVPTAILTLPESLIVDATIPAAASLTVESTDDVARVETAELHG